MTPYSVDMSGPPAGITPAQEAAKNRIVGLVQNNRLFIQRFLNAGAEKRQGNFIYKQFYKNEEIVTLARELHSSPIFKSYLYEKLVLEFGKDMARGLITVMKEVKI